jgi:uncharacterized protein
MSTHEFEVPAKDLDAGGKDYDFVLRAAWIRGILEGDEATTDGTDGSLRVRLSKSGNDVVAHGKLHASLTIPCARCLKPVALAIDQDVAVLYVPAAKVKAAKGKDGKDADEYEFSSEEADTLPYDGETVVLDDLIRDELVLEIPMIPLCSEDCPGIAQLPQTPGNQGAERPVDPRLAALAQWKPGGPPPKKTNKKP